MSKRSTRSFDPGTSVWWLVLPLAGAIVGAAIPHLSALGGVWSVLGPLLGAAAGVVADFTPPVRDWISVRARNKWIAEVSRDSGPIGKAHLDSLRIHRSDRNINDYVRRDAHDKLHDFLKDRTPVLVEGPSMAGKTRLVVEVLREEWPDARVLFPKSEDDVEKLLKNWRRPVRGAIIFLDELERFLGKEEFTLGVLNTWTDDSCTVVATTTRTNYHKWRKQQGSKVPGWEIFNRFHALSLEAKLSKHELEAVRNTSYAGDLASIEQLGLGRVLGRSEDIRRRFTSARESHKGRAGLVKAAVDWSLAGLGAASKQALIMLAKTYDDLWDTPDWEEEWSWVTNETATDTPLLLQKGKNSWEAVELVVNKAARPLSKDTLAAIGASPKTIDQDITFVLKTLFEFFSPRASKRESLEELVDLLKTLTPIKSNRFNTFRFYAAFLNDIYLEFTQTENLYKIDPTHVNNLSNYANFLTTIRHKYKQAEKYYKQVKRIDPTHVNNLSNYANFLTTIRHKHKQAEELYGQAFTIDPSNSNNLGNYSRLLFMTSRDEKGVDFAERALGLAERGQEVLCAECHFYLFMHSPRHRITSGRALKALMTDGVTTSGWSVRGELRTAQEGGKPPVRTCPGSR